MVGTWLLLAVVATLVFPADAEPPSVEVDEAPVRLEEETGSRLHIPNLPSASPIYHIDAGALSFQGNARVEDTLRILPQVFSTQNAHTSHSTEGHVYQLTATRFPTPHARCKRQAGSV